MDSVCANNHISLDSLTAFEDNDSALGVAVQYTALESDRGGRTWQRVVERKSLQLVMQVNTMSEGPWLRSDAVEIITLR